MGGATLPERSSNELDRGLSPRGRGNLQRRITAPTAIRSIPAWAGQPLPTFCRLPRRTVYPRVGGATAHPHGYPCPLAGLSPRGRGNLVAAAGEGHDQRSIPAWAGQPDRRWTHGKQARVYPRVGGATGEYGPEAPERRGLSPRGRGNLDGLDHLRLAYRSIPAWAGQPLEHRM